jgi:hypothetical protein
VSAARPHTAAAARGYMSMPPLTAMTCPLM